MSSESVCQVARSWVDEGSFHTRLFGVTYFAVASVPEFLDTSSYTHLSNYLLNFQHISVQCRIIVRESSQILNQNVFGI
jgi:hypothetical protein